MSAIGCGATISIIRKENIYLYLLNDKFMVNTYVKDINVNEYV